MSPRPQDLEAEIEAQREELAHTVDALGARLEEGRAKARSGALVVGGVAAVVVLAVVLWRRRT